MPFPSDLEIAQAATLRPIDAIATGMGLELDEIEHYGRGMAKIRLEAIDRLAARPPAKVVLVTAVTPTPLGEGKTTTTVGLAQALNRLGRPTTLAIRQPSQGPTFGIKGGAAGGGYSQVVPMEQINLHLTGDIHAVVAANNLLAAMIDNHLFHGNALGIDPYSVTWRRVLDVSDRTLRNVTTGLGSKGDGPMRQTGFDIAVASEVMAILALTTGLKDMRARMARIVVAQTTDGRPVTAEDLGAAGAMTALMKEAIKPNLVQTLENGPALVHAGPFANIAHGNSSVLADLIGTRTGEFFVTEAGFGADIGAEKFFNIKCRASGLRPDAAVIVTTVRAMKLHSGKFRVVPGKPLPDGMLAESADDVLAGAPNLAKQIENVQLHGVTPVVCINRFDTDHDSEVAAIVDVAGAAGCRAAVSTHFADGGAGGEALARAVIEAAEEPSQFRFLYELDQPIKAKIEAIATKVYGAAGVTYESAAEGQIRRFEAAGFGNLPICMAKTHLSLSDDPKKLGAPTGFTVRVREVRASIGAGFIYPLLGEMRTMPGLPSHPAAENVDVDFETGEVVGLF
ncbi:MAG: formate--tetrahydrofolate ligase [Ardenticatenales bacterium]|nr:formate--tetrahydrofolate ligase [Ardenticatenales bacterium]